MPDVSAGQTWVLKLLPEVAVQLGISGVSGSWPPPGVGTGQFHLTITLGTRWRRVVFRETELEDVLKTPRTQSAIRYRLGGALQAIR
jgi:hypothetical protein